MNEQRAWGPRSDNLPDVIDLRSDPATEDELLGLATGVSETTIGRHRGQLSELERSILVLRAPVYGYQLADREIARRLGVPRRRIRQIAAEATRKLTESERA